MNRLVFATLLIAAQSVVACGSSSSSTEEAPAATEGALTEGPKATCTPVERREAVVDYRGDTFKISKITFTDSGESVKVRVERSKVGGGSMDPISATTPSYTQTDRTLRASAKRDIMLKAGKSNPTDDKYVGFVTVHDHTFAVECTVPEASTGCREGDRRPDVDGCNTCSCSGGHWACTELFCGPPRRPTGNGTACQAGDSRPAGDGCNTCSCDSDGQWGGCTELACGAHPPANQNGCQEGASRPDSDGCNTCSCSGGHWACTELFCGGGR